MTDLALARELLAPLNLHPKTRRDHEGRVVSTEVELDPSVQAVSQVCTRKPGKWRVAAVFTSPGELVRAMMSSIAVFDYDVSRETVSEAMNPYLGCQSREEALVKRDLLGGGAAELWRTRKRNV